MHPKSKAREDIALSLFRYISSVFLGDSHTRGQNFFFSININLFAGCGLPVAADVERSLSALKLHVVPSSTPFRLAGCIRNIDYTAAV